MYSRREKLCHYNTLRGGNHAEADFRLLKEKSPSHPMLGIMARNPKRYEDDILFALLDVCSIDEILQSRLADAPSKQTNNDSSKALSKGRCSDKSSSKTPSKGADKNNGSSKALIKDEPSSKTLTSEAHDENTDQSSDVDELSEASDTSDTSTESKKK